MKKTLALTLLALFLASQANAAIWVRDAFTGSTPGAVDAISSVDARPDVAGSQPLTAGDICVVNLSGQIYFVLYDAASTATESVPTVISPDDIGGNPGRWLRIPPFLLPADITGLADAIAASHTHANLAAIAAITNAGSGAIITSTERTNYGTSYSHSQAAHAPVTAEQNINADWTALIGGDDYIANKPTIPTNNNQLTNGSGYITGFTELDPGVNTLGKATLSCTSGQVAKYNGSAWACAADVDTDTNTDVQWSGTATGLTAVTGRTSLGLGTAAVANTGTGTTNVILGNDARLTDTRTPTAHNQAWSTITTTPTTLAGYGITDGGGSSFTADQEAAITESALPSASNVFATIADVTAGGSYTDEAAQAAAGAMVTGNTETGIAVTYDDTANKLNFDASHNHTGVYLTTEVDPTVNTSSEIVAIINTTPTTLVADAAIASTLARDSELHTAVTGTDGVSVTGQLIANTDKGSSAVTTHNGAYTHSNIALNTTHRTSTGADHSWLGQDLRTTATPTFAGLNVDGPDGGRSVALLNNTVAVPCIAGDYRLYPQNGVWKRCENGVSTDVGAGAASGDMLKSVYDVNADNLIDDLAIAATIARDSEIPTNNNQLTNGAGYLTSYTETDPTAEPALGNPSTDGYVLSSTVAGVRSWVVGGSGGSVDLTAPGPIGGGTPDTADFTTLTASSFDWGTPATGQTGEIALLEDPANGANSVTIKAPASVAANLVWTLPATAGTNGQVMKTDAAGSLSWYTPVLVSNNLSEYMATASTAQTNLGLAIGTNVQAYDADLADLADGILTGSKVGTGISAANVTTGTLPDAVIPAAIARDTEMTLAPVTVPTTATGTCTAGTWAYDSALGYIYICIATNTWGRAALSTW